MEERETFGSRLGFLLISAGCAIGLGNVWRFPSIAGQYGGAAFVLIYLFFLLILGLPILVMEFSVGRASRKSAAASFRVLELPGTKWHLFSGFAVAGNYLLMMFYTTVGGWMLAYCFKTAAGQMNGLSTDGVKQSFDHLLAQPGEMVFWMVLVVLIGFGVCSLGLRGGVERITKIMMVCLLLFMAVLAVRSVLLPGGAEGLRFYLMPDFSKMAEKGIGDTIFAAMGQAFFTLSIGMGSMTIFGSYIGREQSLTGESVRITVLDTLVALTAGLIIFPACFAFGVQPDSGPSLVFITLPNIFNQMGGGQLWGTLFFLFLSFAALSTIIAVFENIVSFGMDLRGWSRRKSVLINLVLILVLSLPCVLGFNLLSGIQPFGAGSTIQDLEDFLVSNNVLPLGSLVYLMFCVSRYGWGWDKFTAEANAGKGMKFPKTMRLYVTYVLPAIILVIFVQGYWAKFVH
ncbi:MAG: sodium-dependent transporter [Clostridiales bacterium]|nr:sodium-dependent transporter [Clostridiales bacterium]